VKNIEYQAFLPPRGVDNQLKTDEVLSKTCNPIFRYYVNEFQEIIKMHGSINLIETKSYRKYVIWELMKEGDIYSLIGFYMEWLDLEQNEIHYRRIVWVKKKYKIMNSL